LNILALDTSSKACSCALWREGALAGEYFLNAGLTHSQTILPMVDSLLATMGVEAGEVDLFAVSTGPGSFTGLRIGIAAVKGMAMALNRPCVPVSTLWALALNMQQFRGYVAPVMDARRGQVYTALFRGDGAALRREWADAAVSMAELGAEIKKLTQPVILVGDGAQLCLDTLGGELPELLLAPQTLRHQRAAGVALAAQLAGDAARCTAGELAPVYLRLSQAERERNQKRSDHK